MKLRTTLVIVIVIGFVISFSGGSYLMYSYQYDALIENTHDQLTSQAYERGISLEQINELHIQQLKSIAGSDEVQDIVHAANLMDSGNVVDKDTLTKYTNSLSAELIEFNYNTGGQENGFDNIKVISKSGKIIFSTDKSLIGKDLSKDELFLKGLQKDFRMLTFENEKRRDLVVTPIRDLFGNSADAIGVVEGSTSTYHVDKILQNKVGLGKTGESYLVDSNKTLLTPSRFIEGIFKQKVDTFAVRECFEGGKSSASNYVATKTQSKVLTGKAGITYLGYRGIPVYGASFCEPEMGYVLIMEKDQQEVLEPLLTLQLEYVFTGMILAILLTTFIIVTTKKFFMPFNNVIKSLHKIASGDLDTEIKTSTIEEFSMLANNIDKMRKHIRELLRTRDETIKKRTQILDDTNKELVQNQILLNNYTREISKVKKALDAGSAVTITDKEGTITYVNKLFCDTSKYSEVELIGQNHRILKSGYHTKEFYQGMWNTISMGRTWHGEIKNRAKDGTYYWIKTVIMPILGHDKKPIEYISIRTNITKEKETTEKLNGALIKLREVDRLKNEFGSMVSHELRTPLIPILGYCEMLLDYGAADMSDSQRQIIQNIEKNAKQLRKMIDRILLAQKLELHQIKFEKENINLASFLSDIKRDYKMPTGQKNIELVNTYNEELSLKSDKDRLNEVMANLIENAIYFTPNGGRIEIGASYENNNVVFYVKDNGIGIPQNQQQDLFKKFYQVDASLHREHKGTGLGLAICKEIIESLGGKIWVESQEQKGSTFYFSIPIG